MRFYRSLHASVLPLLAVATASPFSRNDSHIPRERAKKVSDKYDIGKVLGTGGFSVVKLAREKSSGAEFAAKFFDMKSASTKEIQAEIDMLRWIGTHANIVSLRDVIYEPNNIVMVMDLVRGGELFEYIVSQGSITEAEASRMLRDVCRALHHLHQRGVCHRDMKPENLLLTEVSSDADIKIADFGQSIRQPIGEKIDISNPGGTIVYWAPEIIKRSPQDMAVDMWAFGVLLYITLTGIHPFDPKGNYSDAQIINLVVKGSYDDTNPWFISLSDEAKDLLQHLLVVDPDDRYTAEQVLKHPWMNPRLQRRLSRRYREGLSSRLQAYRRLQQLRANIATLLFSKQLHETKSGRPRRQLETLNHQVYQEVFSMFDIDHNGTISKDELTQMLQALGQIYTTNEIDDIMNIADIDQDGGISLSEFTILMNSTLFQVGQWDENDLKAAFEIFDKNKDGFIGEDELAYVLNVLDKNPITSQELTELIQSIDENGDGKIDYKEFSALMKNWLSGKEM